MSDCPPKSWSTRGAAKSAICTAIASLPISWWPVASAIVRRVWPGFREA